MTLHFRNNILCPLVPTLLISFKMKTDIKIQHGFDYFKILVKHVQNIIAFYSIKSGVYLFFISILYIVLLSFGSFDFFKKQMVIFLTIIYSYPI